MEQEVKFWLAKTSSETTREQYARRIKKYMEWSGLTAAQLLTLKDNGDSEAEKLLDRFVMESPYTKAQTCNVVVAVRSFYRAHYKDLSKQAGRQAYEVPRQKAYAEVTQKKLRRFIDGAFYIRDKALIAFVASTFIREGSIPLLKIRHVEGLWEELSK